MSSRRLVPGDGSSASLGPQTASSMLGSGTVTSCQGVERSSSPRPSPSRIGFSSETAALADAAVVGEDVTDASVLYQNECAAKMVKPNHDLHNVFRMTPSSSIVTLQLERNYIGDIGLACLSKVIAEALPNLQAVGLGSNGIANNGVAALCAALNQRCQSGSSLAPILVLDLRDNPKVTRAGGQSLLNAVSRIRNRLSFIQLLGTRVTDYFECRIIRHVQRQYDSLVEAEQLEVFALCSDLGLVGDEQQMQQQQDEDGDRGGIVLIPGSPSSLLPQLGRSSSTAAPDRTLRGSIAPMFQANAPFDEIWYCEDADVAPVVTAQPESRNSEAEIARPSAPSGLESVLYSATPDFYSVYQDRENAGSALSRKFTITSMPTRERTVYGFCTPTADEIELFNLVDMYKPKNIELPTAFIFPGKLEYVPAVHAPDPMLYPMPPASFFATGNRRVGESSQQSVGGGSSSAGLLPPQPNGSAQQESEEQKSMFWSFFHSASATSSGTSRTGQPLLLHSTDGTTPVEQPQRDSAVQQHQLAEVVAEDASEEVAAAAIPEGDEQIDTQGGDIAAATTPVTATSSSSSNRFDPVTFALKRVNSVIAAARPQVSHRTLAFSPSPLPSASVAPLASCESRPLWQLISDPNWVPTRPTRGSQVTEYCAQNKIKYNCVSRERKRNPTSTGNREFFLQRVIQPSLTDNLSAGAMNTKGNMLVTSNYDMTCKVWDLETGRRLHTLRGHTGHLSDCVWNAPICDKVITASFDKTLKVWSVARGELLHTLRGHELEVVCVAVSPDGLECASGAMDDLAIIWDLQTGAEKFSLHGHSAEIIAIDFSPVGRMCVTGSMDETARVWNTSDGSCLHVLEGHTAEVGQVKFNCFGNIVLTGSIDCTCKLWDVSTGKHKTLRGHTHEVVDCDFSPDGWICASASDDGTVRIWDVLTGGCMTLIVGHERGVCRLAFTSPPGKELITGSLDTTAKVWNIETGECKQTLRGHKGLVLVNYNPASERILTLSRDNTCRIWKLEPESNSLFHSAAMAICQHPTIYSDSVSTQALPTHVIQHLQRTHRKAMRSEDTLVPPTPIPSIRSPNEDDVSHTVDE